MTKNNIAVASTRACARGIVDLLLRLNTTKLPRHFCLRDRLSYLVRGLEPSIVRVAKDILQPGDTAVDIGANVGFLTRQFASMVGKNGRVYAFEPDPSVFAYLAFNTRKLSQVSLSQLALSDQNGTSTLYLHPTSAMSNSLVNAWANANPLTVQVLSYDSWAAALHLGRVKLIKIDVEGAEPLVLRGMFHTLSSSPRPQIIAEFCPANLGNRMAEEEFFQILARNGYTIWRIACDATLHAARGPEDVKGHLNENGYVNLLARVDS